MTREEAIARLTAPGEPYELVEVGALGRRVRAFRNGPPTLRELFDAARSDRTFLVYGDEHLSFEETWRQAARFATVLVEDYGVRKGDRVAISMRNYPEWIIAFNAAVSIGAVAVAMNALWQGEEMSFALNDCRPKVLVADQERLDRLATDQTPAGLAVIAVRGAHRSDLACAGMGSLMAGRPQAALPAVLLGPDDDAIMLYTSGSTGRPKGAVSTHRNVLSALLSWELDYEVSILQGRPEPAEPAYRQSAALLGIPLFHVSGLHVSLLQSYRAQRRLVTMYKWDPELALDIIEREEITMFNGPPAVTGDLVQVARRRGRSLETLVSVGGGGAGRAPEQVRAIDETFPNAAPSTGWGMTETNAIGVGISGADYLRHPESSGQVSAVLDIRIVDETGQEVPTGSRGELQVRGASIMRGYWERPEANVESFDGDWFRTGDVAYRNEEGFVFIVDRIKDLIIRGGENVGCGQVENALLEHPAVVEASVYGVPDLRLGEEVAASIFANRALDAAELRDFLQTRLAAFQIPQHFHFPTAPLPRIASGKIAKRDLRDLAVARLSQTPSAADPAVG